MSEDADPEERLRAEDPSPEPSPETRPDRLPGPPPGRPPSSPPPPQVFVRFGLVFYGLLAAAAVVWRVGWQGEPIWARSVAIPAAGETWLRDVGIGVAVGAILLGLSELATRRTRWGESLARSLAEGLGPLAVPDALLLASASGLAEELFFRGALQPVAGWFWASLLFGVLHFVPRREFAPWTVFAVLAGMLFGGMYEWTGNLTAPVVAHTLVNGVNLPRLVREYGSGVSRPGR